MTNVKIKKDEQEPESTEILAKSIIQIADGFERLLRAPLTTRAIVVLLQDGIGATRITKKQIQDVLEALPRLKGWYIRKEASK